MSCLLETLVKFDVRAAPANLGLVSTQHIRLSLLRHHWISLLRHWHRSRPHMPHHRRLLHPSHRRLNWHWFHHLRRHSGLRHWHRSWTHVPHHRRTSRLRHYRLRSRLHRRLRALKLPPWIARLRLRTLKLPPWITRLRSSELLHKLRHSGLRHRSSLIYCNSSGGGNSYTLTKRRGGVNLNTKTSVSVQRQSCCVTHYSVDKRSHNSSASAHHHCSIEEASS